LRDKDANVNIDTLRFSHILEAHSLYHSNYFFAHTVFVIAHKNERIETLLSVIWYLPVNSPVLVVSNCSETGKETLKQELARHLGHCRQVYFIHQKDESLARFFAEQGVHAIIGTDGKVVNGKGEGMYIGALIASLLKSPKWIVFYDADNFVPNALLEYTLAMSKLFMQQYLTDPGEDQGRSCLQNVRICWASKPSYGSDSLAPRVLGRCTRVVSPLMTTVIAEWFGVRDQTIITSNAGEQGFTMKAIQALRFSSGYSVETFQLLELLSKALSTTMQPEPDYVILQQYQAQSPHFHEKREDEHIKRMVAESLGCFFYFKKQITPHIKRQLQKIYREMELERHRPVVYPALQMLSLEAHYLSADQYLLLEGSANEQETLCG
jgi:mannosyl-3-phosphoglycerate synthase